MHVITSTFFTLNDSYMPGYAVMRAQVSALYHSPGQKPQKGCRESPCGDADRPLSAFGEARFATEDVISAAPSGREGIACPSATATCSGIAFDWGLSKCVCALVVASTCKIFDVGQRCLQSKGGCYKRVCQQYRFKWSAWIRCLPSSVRG
jgi:hypothetical protein